MRRERIRRTLLSRIEGPPFCRAPGGSSDIKLLFQLVVTIDFVIAVLQQTDSMSSTQKSVSIRNGLCPQIGLVERPVIRPIQIEKVCDVQRPE